MNPDSRARQFWALCKKHKKFVLAVAVFLILLIVVLLYSPRIQALHPKNVKSYILSFGAIAPIVFMLLLIAKVIFAIILGQAMGFAGGYVFGWKLGFAYTMIGLGLGSLMVFILARKFGRPFVEKFNAPEVIHDFENLLIPPASKVGHGVIKMKQHGLLAFFVIMLLPALPDDLVCFVAGLSRIPVWKLLLAALVGRAPGMLVLSLVGDGVSRETVNIIYVVFIAFWVAVTVIYFWKKKAIEDYMLRFAQKAGSK